MRATKFLRSVVPGLFENERKLDGVWVDRRFLSKESSEHICDDACDSAGRNIGFLKNANGGREGINNWAYKNTNQLIRGAMEKKCNAFHTLAHRLSHSEGNSVQVPVMTSNKKQYVSGVSQKERSPQARATNICIKLKSYDQPFLENWELPPHTKQIGLPESRVLYTVLRSPHIDKKSREQFEMRIKKAVLKTETNDLRKKLFWLKRQRIFGAQCEILISCKTRLDKEKIQSLL